MANASLNAKDAARRRRFVLTLVAVFAIFVLALFLRAYWNVDAATTDGGFVMSAGSDPYYHKRAIDYIQSNGWQTLVDDPMLNYPYGAKNPNPPLFQWSVAVTGAALSPFFNDDPATGMSGLEVATWWAMLWSPAIWGALTVLPVYLIGRDVFDRRVGIVGAFLLAVSTTHIDHTALGAADHDAMLLFFGVFAFWAFIRSVQGFRGDQNWVKNWRDPQSRSDGMGRFFRERRGAIGWAVLAGVFTAAVGLIWKGFPYLIGIFFAYSALQLVIDHWRSKDSTGIWFGSLIAMLVGTVLLVPAYSTAGVLTFLKPVWFLILAHAVFGLVMVPTRDLPTLLVIPAFAVVGVLGALAAFFVVPDVARSLLYSTVYFKQTSLYQTIAEAHPADFNTLVFGVGPIAFFLALFGLVWLGVSARRSPTRASLFMIVWAVIALYMAQSAVRFLFNATPILSVLAAWSVVMLFDWADFRSISRTMAGSQGFWSGLRRAVNGWHVTIAVLVSLVLVFPSVFLAVDASAPGEVEDEWIRGYLVDYLGEHQERHNFTRAELEGFATGDFSYFQPTGLWSLWFNERAAAEGIAAEDLDAEIRKDLASWGGMPVFIAKRFGAFGQGFLPGYWKEGLTNLSKLDDCGQGATVDSMGDCGDAGALNGNRPGFLSWWDYGHWAIEVGRHPAVADNFQNGYEYAANFILAQNETHSVQLLAARSLPHMDANGNVARGLLTETVAKDLLRQAGVPEDKVDETYGQLIRWQYAPALDLDRAVAFEALVTQATETDARPDGVRIRYFAVDSRMLPYDDPRTQEYVDQPSIFYAPVVLKGDEPSEYVETKITGSNGVEYTEEGFLAESKAVTRHRQFYAAGQSYLYKQPFFDSMYYRAFVGTPVQAGEGVDGSRLINELDAPKPGFGLKHWRSVILSPQLRVLEYYPGAILTGTVTEAGEPIAGARVTAYDDNGRFTYATLDSFSKSRTTPDALNVPHDSVTTDANGTYRLVLPFNLEGGNVTVVVDQGGVEVSRQTFDVSREAASTGAEFATHNFNVEKGSVDGFAFHDANGNGTFDAGDQKVGNVTVDVGGSTDVTDESGDFNVENVSPGSRQVRVTSADYEVSQFSQNVVVPSGKNVTHNVALNLKKVSVTGNATYEAADGTVQPAANVRLTFTPDEDSTGVAATATTAADGIYTAPLTPGEYTVTGNHTVTDPTTNATTTYSFTGTLTVPRASEPVPPAYDIRLVRVENA